MDTTTLGRTGLSVSVAGLGGGGASRLGLGSGKTDDEAVRIVHRALDLGVTLIDTAAANETETIIGKAIAGRRDKIVLSTKAQIVKKGLFRPNVVDAAELTRRIDASLKRLGTDHIDVFHLHSVQARQLGHVRKVLLPALLEARKAGKIRFLGITESFVNDPGHRMLSEALADDCWDVVMVGFNLLNRTARADVLAQARKKSVGVIAMYAVRRALKTGELLLESLARAEAAGEFRMSALDPKDPFGFLLKDASTLAEAAYRFCRHEPGIDVVLTGTGNLAHLESNVRALNAGPLPAEVVTRLDTLFGGIRTVTGE